MSLEYEPAYASLHTHLSSAGTFPRVKRDLLIEPVSRSVVPSDLLSFSRSDLQSRPPSDGLGGRVWVWNGLSQLREEVLHAPQGAGATRWVVDALKQKWGAGAASQSLPSLLLLRFKAAARKVPSIPLLPACPYFHLC